jgi:gliding motility-associated-like protein
MIVLGNTANIGGATTPNYIYAWTPAATVANATILNTQATPAVSTFYIVEATDQNGCIGYDTMLVIVTNCSNVFIPKAFSPNGDGKNDHFFIANAMQLTSLKRFEVFNRWGQKVYSSKNKMDQGWDGKFNGVDQEVGAYTFYLEAECEGGQIVRKEGSVTLLR